MRFPSTNPIFHSKRVLFLGSTLTLISCLLWWTPPIQDFNRRVSDSWYSLRTEAGPSPEVALILIDDHSLQQFGRWPWPRTLLADLVRKTSASNPKVIGLDILLPEAESEASDDALAEAIRSAGNVVLVSKISGSSEGGLWIEPLPKFTQAARSTGHAQAILDPDGVCRRFPLAEMSLDGPHNAFALEVSALSDRDAETAFTRFHEARTGHPLVERRAEIDTVSPLVAPISFRTRTRGSRFTTIPAAEVLNGSTFASLKGKSVLIGFGSSDIHDRLVIPVSESIPTPGVEIHAHIVDAILSHRFLAPISLSSQFIVLVFVCFFSALLNLRQRTWTAALGSACFCVLIYVGGYVAFIRFNRSSDAGLMMCSALLALPLAQLEKLLRVERSITRQLHDLRSTLTTPDSPPAIASDPSVNWKLDTLAALQAKLASMYEFEHALLENTHDRIAVFSTTGEMMFCNSAFRQLWSSECGTSDVNMQAFRAWLTRSGITLELEKLPVVFEALLGGRLWNLRLTEMPPGDATPAQLMVVMTDLQARLERDQTRTEALAFVTHELRTPLVAIQGFAELMMRFPQQPDSREAPEVVFRESRRLVALINSYLDVLRLDSGARPIRIAPVDINLVVQRTARVLQPLADANHNRVTVSRCSKDPVAFCDGALISGALMNLVSNAIKYGGETSDVRMSIDISDCDLVLSVWNSGPPIPQQDLEHLFDPYFRGSAEHDQRPGWGLGLAFVKRVVDQHHGKVTATSSEQYGTEFQIVLPGAIRLLGREVGAS